MVPRRWNCRFRIGAKWRELVAQRLSVEAGGGEHKSVTLSGQVPDGCY